MTSLYTKIAFSLVVVLMSACASIGVVSEETLVGDEAHAESAMDMCGPEQGVAFSFRKKLAVLAASISHPLSARDLPNLGLVWSEALQKAYADSGQLLVVDASDVHLHRGEGQREWVIETAARLNVQFLVVATFNNLHIQRSQFGLGSYSVPLPIVRRDIDTEIFIFDGYSGNRMARFTQSAVVRGFEHGVVNPQGQPVMMGAFLNTPLGKAFDGLLASQVKASMEWLACIPLMERVSRVSGNTLYLSVAGVSNLRPGDRLQLFRHRGDIDSHLGPVDITKVFPNSVVGVYKGSAALPKSTIGLRVRAW